MSPTESTPLHPAWRVAGGVALTIVAAGAIVLGAKLAVYLDAELVGILLIAMVAVLMFATSGLVVLFLPREPRVEAREEEDADSVQAELDMN